MLNKRVQYVCVSAGLSVCLSVAASQPQIGNYFKAVLKPLGQQSGLQLRHFVLGRPIFFPIYLIMFLTRLLLSAVQ